MKLLKELYARYLYEKYHIRPMFQYMEKKENMIGIEIGVSEGEGALNMLKRLSLKKLYLIDPYNSILSKKVKQYRILQKALKVTEKYANIRQFLIKTSNCAVKSIKEEVDFVYIDGNHKYFQVKKDIENYYPLVKSGGTIGGHDFTEDGVMRAVSEFAHKNKLKVHFLKCDWWLLKK